MSILNWRPSVRESAPVVQSNAIAKAAAPKAKTGTVGVIGLKTSSGFVEEEFITGLRWPQAGKVYQEMAYNDAVVGGCLYLMETLIRQAKWHVKPASQDPGDIEAAAFLESCMFDMQDQTWDDFICEALSMLTYGFSFHEIVYKVRRGPLEKDLKFKSNFTDGKIGWQELPARSQVTMDHWTFDPKSGKALTFYQDPSLAGAEGSPADIPIEGNLLFKTKSSRGNPEGWSILRRAYRSWYFKRYIEELEGIGVERNLAGIPILQPPADLPLFDPNNDEMRDMLAWAQALVNDLRQDKNHGIVLPGDWTLDLLGSKGAGNSGLNTDTIIRRHENRIAMSMLSDVVMMGGDRTGSFALADTKKGLLLTSLESIINSIASTLNTKAVPILFALNSWTLEKLPQIVADDLEPVSISEIALLLRTFKIDVTKNQDLLNFLLSAIQAPELDEKAFNELIAQQSSGKEDSGDEGTKLDTDDSLDNQFKQGADTYEGQEGEA